MNQSFVKEVSISVKNSLIVLTIMNLILITKWLKSKLTATLILRKAVINAVPIKLKSFTN